jgi:hypothetical protein
MENTSWRRNQGGRVLKEETWRRSHGENLEESRRGLAGRNVGKESWRNLGEGVAWKDACTGNHGELMKHRETYERHLEFGGENMEEEYWRMNLEEGIQGEES